MTTFGLSSAGFNVPRSADFLTLIRETYEDETELDIDWEADVFLGQTSAIMASRLGELADIVQAAADAFDVSGASGRQLDNLCLLVGVFRQAATYSTATVILTGEPLTLIPQGTLVEGGGPSDSSRWQTGQDTELVETTLTTGDLTFSVTSAQDRIERTDGTWAEDGVTIGTQLTITGSGSNNTVVTVAEVVDPTTIAVEEDLTGEGPVGASVSCGLAEVTVQAMAVGAVSASARKIDAIATPIAGWQTVVNPVQAATGRNLETDSALRIRRQQSLQASGSGSIRAIRSNLLELASLSAVVVLENNTLSTATVAGLTLYPKSLRVVVYPSSLTDAQKIEVAQTIYDHAPAGIEILGADVEAVVESTDGFEKTVKYDFATELAVDVVTTLVLATDYELEDVQEQVEDTIQAYFDALGVGDAVRELALSARVAEVEGVVGATFTFNGGSTDIEPLITQLPVLDANTVGT